MLSIYLNSLNNLLIRKNPLKLIWERVKKNTLVVLHLRRNMSAAHRKLMVMENRKRRVREFVDHPERHRLDLRR